MVKLTEVRAMGYSIKEAAQITGVTINTLRYYDNEGLIPNLKRTPAGYRVFYDIDLEVIRTIQIFKKSGMAIKDIKEYLELFLAGEATQVDRQQLLLAQRGKLLEEQARLNETLAKLDSLIDFNQKATASNEEAKIRAKARKLAQQKESESSSE